MIEVFSNENTLILRPYSASHSRGLPGANSLVAEVAVGGSGGVEKFGQCKFNQSVVRVDRIVLVLL